MRQGNYRKIKFDAEMGEFFDAVSLEQELQIATTTNAPIEATSPMIYTERKDGVKPEYDIRTDRWEIAQQAMDHVAASYKAKRADFIKSQMNSDNEGEA